MSTKRDERGRLLPGSVNNPKGRPRTGLAWGEAIREFMERDDRRFMRELLALLAHYATRQPLSCDVEYLRACALARSKNEPEPPPSSRGEVVLPTVGESMRAIELFLAWAYEKPAERHDVVARSESPQVDYSAMTAEELEALEAIHRSVLARSQGALPDTTR